MKLLDTLWRQGKYMKLELEKLSALQVDDILVKPSEYHYISTVTILKIVDLYWELSVRNYNHGTS